MLFVYKYCETGATLWPVIFSVFHLSNKSLPWDYNFRFVIEEISNINDKAQVS